MGNEAEMRPTCVGRYESVPAMVWRRHTVALGGRARVTTQPAHGYMRAPHPVADRLSTQAPIGTLDVLSEA